MKGRQGFSIIEALVAVGLMGILIAGAAHLATGYSRSVHNSIQRGRLEDLRIYIRTHFDCAATLAATSCECSGDVQARTKDSSLLFDDRFGGSVTSQFTCSRDGGFFQYVPKVTIFRANGTVAKDTISDRELADVKLTDDIPLVCSAAPSLASRYRYLAAGLGMTMAAKQALCGGLGATWRIATVDDPAEPALMRQYLVQEATPANGVSVFSLPTIATPCADVRTMILTGGLEPDVDCSGPNLIVAWPDVWDRCESGARGTCAFHDDGNEANWPVLCEDNSPLAQRGPCL